MSAPKKPDSGTKDLLNQAAKKIIPHFSKTRLIGCITASAVPGFMVGIKKIQRGVS